MITILDSVSEIYHEINLFQVPRRHSTLFITEISSGMHFRGLEGPEMVKVELKLRFSKSRFS